MIKGFKGKEHVAEIHVWVEGYNPAVSVFTNWKQLTDFQDHLVRTCSDPEHTNVKFMDFDHDGNLVDEHNCDVIHLDRLYPDGDFSNHDRLRVYSVYRKLLEAIIKAEANEIPFAAVFNHIPIRDCLAQYTVLATAWHIDDIRDRYPKTTSDDELFQTLLEQEDALSNVAVSSGNDWIECELPSVRDEEDEEELAAETLCDWCDEVNSQEKTASKHCENCGFNLCEDCLSYSPSCPNCQSQTMTEIEPA
ncbi:hypothetical protein ABES02_29755 [Neobacillus pocheonensis]|uniref:hypothetical protein n=1 Tax=Neobacillus pocheonensis TaxID=363869 RepID=UPI003D29E35B